MNYIDRMYKQKKFFRVIFGDEIGKGGYLKDDQHIRIFQNNDRRIEIVDNPITKVKLFNNVDDAISYCSSKFYNLNTYFTLSTTNATGGTKEDLINRTVLGFDFDKKDLGEDFSFKDLIDKFKSIGLWYHAIVDSGNGYHVYVCIQPTKNIDKVAEVTKVIGNKLGADLQAMKGTQILRVPFTFNIKDKPKQVNIINMYEKDTIKRYNIDDLYNRYCTNARDQQKGTGERVMKFTINNTNIPSCIEKMLLEGSAEGTRYSDLNKIVVTLRDRNKSLNEIKALSKEWASKSNYKDNLDCRVEHIYNNRKYANMNCDGCNYKEKCFSRIESYFNFSDSFNVLSMTETHTSKLKVSKRKGAKVMQSNDLLVYCILQNHIDGLYREELIKEMTYKGKVCFSKDTLTKTLQSLEDNGFIEVTGKPKFYKLKDIKSKIELTYNVSFGATYECIKGNISTEELKLYNYMRYLHNKQQRENTKALKGNLFQFNQNDLAKNLGLTQGRISQMINNLLEEKILSIWYRQPSKNNGFDFYIYRLNY